MKFNIIIEKWESGWLVGQLAEFPSAVSKGRTLEELKQNLIDTLKFIMEANRERISVEYEGRNVIKAELQVSELVIA
jgi:predicted RNase H-like HicB family nuclease